ncbi:MAG: Glu-tRNA(Gln) amidotransferase subunit GatE [Candidatus Micrarchaeia archaeon]
MPQQKNPNSKDDYYKSIGFLCGLEIHQRLATEEKLFCSCSAVPSAQDEKPIASIYRMQRAVAGELGKIDRSTEFESERKRDFLYNIFNGHTCLVDIDEEPPHELNSEALEIALAIAKGMNCRIVDEVEPMRKEVVDGSDPSAFQRTMLIGINGSINVNGLAISIPSIFLEEESSGISESKQNAVAYDTDRLGIPLIEIDTDKYIPTPKAAKEAALLIGTMVRITGKVQRGIGTIRQDVNVSISGGARVEIKGVQEVDMIDVFVENEVKRQQALIEIKDELKKRNAKVGDIVDITNVFKETSSPMIKSALAAGGVALAMPLYGFSGLLGREINPNTRLGTEISEYAKKAGVKGLIHSDEDMSKYSISETEVHSVVNALGTSNNDGFVIIVGQRGTLERAMELAKMRAIYALQGVPEETRVAYDSKLGTTRFLRPLPGGSRMYPETDVRPVVISEQMLVQAEKLKPDMEKTLSRLTSEIGEQLAMQMLKSPKLGLYNELTASSNVDKKFVANMLLQQFTELRRNGYDVESIDVGKLKSVIREYMKGAITKQAVPEVLKVISKSNSSVEKAIKDNSLERISGNELKALVEKYRKENPSNLQQYIMSKYRVNIDGNELNEILGS